MYIYIYMSAGLNCEQFEPDTSQNPFCLVQIRGWGTLKKAPAGTTDNDR